MILYYKLFWFCFVEDKLCLRVSIFNKDLNIELILFFFSDSIVNVFLEFIFGCLCNKNVNMLVYKGIFFFRW